MAVLAEIAALNVAHWFPCRADSIVAGKTRACQVGVIKTRAQPSHRPMTVLAKIGRLRVTRRLPRRAKSVVAIRAAADHRGVIDPRWNPSDLQVAVSTLVGRPNMPNIFSGVAQYAAAIVAYCAAHRCALKAPPDVAFFARHTLVSAHQGKPGSKVIEVVYRRFRSGHFAPP